MDRDGAFSSRRGTGEGLLPAPSELILPRSIRAATAPAGARHGPPRAPASSSDRSLREIAGSKNHPPVMARLAQTPYCGVCDAPQGHVIDRPAPLPHRPTGPFGKSQTPQNGSLRQPRMCHPGGFDNYDNLAPPVWQLACKTAECIVCGDAERRTWRCASPTNSGCSGGEGTRHGPLTENRIAESMAGGRESAGGRT